MWVELSALVQIVAKCILARRFFRRFYSHRLNFVSSDRAVLSVGPAHVPAGFA